jgi:hypothetical protein
LLRRITSVHGKMPVFVPEFRFFSSPCPANIVLL